MFVFFFLFGFGLGFFCSETACQPPAGILPGVFHSSTCVGEMGTRQKWEQGEMVLCRISVLLFPTAVAV